MTGETEKSIASRQQKKSQDRMKVRGGEGPGARGSSSLERVVKRPLRPEDRIKP